VGCTHLSLESQIEQLAKSATLVDGQDPVGLVSLQELFQSLAHDATAPELEPVADQAMFCSELLGQLVMREIEDVDEAFKQMFQCIEYAQEAIDCVTKGKPAPTPPGEKLSGDQEAPPIDRELLAEWLSSCDGLLGEVEANTLALETSKEPDTLIADLRRHVHTLKGECGVLSLGLAQRMCHEAESLVDRETGAGRAFPSDAVLCLVDWLKLYATRLGDNPRSLPPEHADLEQALMSSGGEAETADTADSANASASDSVGPAPAADTGELVDFELEGGEDENLVDFLCEAREHIAAAEAALLELEQDFTDSELINTVFRAFHTVKGVAGFLHLQPIVDLAHNAEFLLDEARKEAITLNSAYLNLILQSCDMLAALLAALEGQDAPVRFELDTLITALQKALECSPEETGAATPAAAAPAPAATPAAAPEAAPEAAAPVAATPQAAPPAAAPPAAKKEAKRSKADITVKVNNTRLDTLVTMVGELVIAQQMVLQDDNITEIKDQRFQRNLVHTGKIIRDLQEVAMSLRMVTVKGTFQKMARLVRDVSLRAGKKIQFHMEGEETELDRTVVDEIGDPLVHIIRNACDHGVETPEDRVAAGKSETGNLTLRAYHQGGSIMIELQDDGQGLDRDRILKKAVDQGLIAADRDPASIPDSEAFNLIMLPGFSTAEKVTDISGRGVGMDVVRRNIEALRGTLEIDSVRGQGTKFRMALPLTMAIIDGMVVQVGEQRYVIPTLAIERSYRPTHDDLHTVAGRGEMAAVRGALLPIYRLNRLFDLSGAVEDLTEGLLIVLERGESRCCLVVDQILGQQQVVIKSLGQGIKHQPGVSGGAILGDGRVALIIDVGGLIDQATRPNENLKQHL
jgi:two-component system chemotaxis sensor kinase CheA